MNRKNELQASTECNQKKVKNFMYFYLLFHRDYIETGTVINHSFELSVLVIMIVTTILAYFQTSKLDINHHPLR